MVRIPEDARSAPKVITTSKQELVEYLRAVRFNIEDFPVWERPYLAIVRRGGGLYDRPPAESPSSAGSQRVNAEALHSAKD